ncbi:MAG: hypothetical protein AAF487_02105 [Bacteroidota bacterium]
MKRSFSAFIFIFFAFTAHSIFAQKLDYRLYHQEVIKAETFIGEEKYQEALQIFDSLFHNYEFVFLRDIQIASQLAYFLKEEIKTTELIIKGIRSGWSKKSIRKNDFLKKWRASQKWKDLVKDNRIHFEKSIDQDLKKQVRKMFARDQWKALGALFRLSANGQDRYAERKFAPHSEKQMRKLGQILKEKGYPGEKLVGQEVWMCTIICHHNSISKAYNERDTLYAHFKKDLEIAFEKGELSAFSRILIEEWFRAVQDLPQLSRMGILDGPSKENLTKVNELRDSYSLRSIEVHNNLVDIEEKTGMNLYFDGHPWYGEKTEIH